MKDRDYGPLFWIHLPLSIFFMLSFLFFSWWIIVIAQVLLMLQYRFVGSCILAKAEFGNNEAFIPYYLKKWGWINDKQKTKIFIRYHLPLIVIALALILQLLLNFKPLIF